MQCISVKELREKFPFVRSELKKGESFIIIYKSKPIAELKSTDKIETYIETTDEDIEKTAAADWLRMYPPITKEEDDYYMSLPTLKN